MIVGVLFIGLDMLRVSRAEKREVERQQVVAIKAKRASAEVERLRLAATLEQQKEDEAAKVRKQRQELVDASLRAANLEQRVVRATQKAADEARLLAAAKERERQRIVADEARAKLEQQVVHDAQKAADEARLLAAAKERERQRIMEDEARARSRVPSKMVRIPAGTSMMGDSRDARRPPRDVTISAFYLQNTEATYEQWKEIADWNTSGSRGYDFGVGQRGAAGRKRSGALTDTAANNAHPVTMVSWWDIVKWCNAKSRREGITPCYYTDDRFTMELKSGTPRRVYVNWAANGYRLPTAAEWEYAARGGVEAMSYPWGEGIAINQANYSSYFGGDRGTTQAGYYDGNQTPAGVDMKNGYGLYDMAGNVWEWNWNWESYGSNSLSVQKDPRGSDFGSYRVFRGGSWNSGPCPCSWLERGDPGDRANDLGFRPARSSVP